MSEWLYARHTLLPFNIDVVCNKYFLIQFCDLVFINFVFVLAQPFIFHCFIPHPEN